MKLFTIKTLIFFTIFSQEVFAQKTEFKVMAWNILRSGNQIENGVDNVADMIKEINPDIVLMVETYGSGPYIAKKNGYNFHLVAKEVLLLMINQLIFLYTQNFLLEKELTQTILSFWVVLKFL